jgi:hypothetical protein
MLDQSVSPQIAAPEWDALPLRAEPPEGEVRYLHGGALGLMRPESRRSHRRLAVRRRVVLASGELWMAGYLHDFSARGIGVLTPIQILPNQSATVFVDDLPPWEFRLRRCRRFGPGCFFCGGDFFPRGLTPRQFADFAKLGGVSLA